VPCRGIERNDLWWSLRVAAVNLRRLLALGLARQDQTWALNSPRQLTVPLARTDTTPHHPPAGLDRQAAAGF
jgi:hypothetical protein